MTLRRTPLKPGTKPLERRTELRADPDATREWQDRSRKELPAVNRERMKRRHAEAYGDKAEWARTLPCYATQRPPPSVAAHVVSRGAGGKSEHIVPFNARVEVDWHGMDEAKWIEKYGVSKQDCRDAAERYEAAWQRMQGGEE